MRLSEVLRAKQTPWGEDRISRDADWDKVEEGPNWQLIDQNEHIAIATPKDKPNPTKLYMFDLSTRQVIGVFDLWGTKFKNTYCVGNIQVRKTHSGQRFAYAFYRYALLKLGYCIRSGDVHTPASERTWVRLASDPEFTVLAAEDHSNEWSEVRVVQNKLVYASGGEAIGKPSDPYTGSYDTGKQWGPDVHLFCFAKQNAPEPLIRLQEHEQPKLGMWDAFNASNPWTRADHGQTAYVRFGDLPEGGRSKIGRAPNIYAHGHIEQRGGRELGVSVYEITWDQSHQRWSILDCGNYASLDELFAQKRPAFMVTGDPVVDEEGIMEYGIDDEPLLTNVQIVRQMRYDELYVPAWGGNPMPEEYLDMDFD